MKNCPPGHYHVQPNAAPRKCQKCLHCPLGQEPSVKCDGTIHSEKVEAQCIDCKEGYFKEYEGHSSCKPCSTCFLHQEETKSCQVDQNRHCGNCTKGYYPSPDSIACHECCSCGNDTTVEPNCKGEKRCRPNEGIKCPTEAKNGTKVTPTQGSRPTKVVPQTTRKQLSSSPKSTTKPATTSELVSRSRKLFPTSIAIKPELKASTSIPKLASTTGKISIGTILGGAAGGLVVIILLAVFYWWSCWKKRGAGSNRRPSSLSLASRNSSKPQEHCALKDDKDGDVEGGATSVEVESTVGSHWSFPSSKHGSNNAPPGENDTDTLQNGILLDENNHLISYYNADPQFGRDDIAHTYEYLQKPEFKMKCTDPNCNEYFRDGEFRKLVDGSAWNDIAHALDEYKYQDRMICQMLVRAIWEKNVFRTYESGSVAMHAIHGEKPEMTEKCFAYHAARLGLMRIPYILHSYYHNNNNAATGPA